MATGVTAGKYTILTYNSQVVRSVTKISAAGLNYPPVDVTTFSSSIKENLLAIPEVKISVEALLDNTATTGALTVFSAAGVLGNQTGAPLLIDWGIRATATTGDPRFSNTLMSVAGLTIDSDPNGTPTMKMDLVSLPGSAASFTTKP